MTGTVGEEKEELRSTQHQTHPSGVGSILDRTHSERANRLGNVGSILAMLSDMIIAGGPYSRYSP